MSIPPDVLDQFLVQMVEQGLRTGHLTNFIRQQKSTPSYMSQTALDRAIVSAMDKQGRLYASEFSGSLDIPLQTVIHAWSVLAPQYEWLVMDDVALTSDYVAKIVDRLQVQINDAGCLSMVTLAQQLGLPYALIQKILDPLAVANDEDDSKDLIIYPQLSNLILTRRYANDAKERLQGALDQATQPLSMFKLQRELLLEEESLFYVLLDAVIKRSSSAGVFRGRHDKAVYVPHVYRDAQMDLIKSLVAAGGYIEYETVERSYPYRNPKDLLARHFPDIIFLPTCAVTPACLDEQESIAENALKSKEGWCDFSQNVPSAFAAADVTAVVDMVFSRLQEKYKKIQRQQRRRQSESKLSSGGPVLLGTHFLTTADYLQFLIESTQDKLDQRAQHEIRHVKKQHSGKTKKTALADSIRLQQEEVNDYLTELGLPDAFAEAAAPALVKPMTEALQRAIRSVYVPASLVNRTSPSQQQQERQQAYLRNARQRIYYTQLAATTLFKQPETVKSLEKYIARQLGLDLVYHVALLSYLQEGASAAAERGIQQAELEHPERMTEDRKRQVVETYAAEQGKSDAFGKLLKSKKTDTLMEYLSSLDIPNAENLDDDGVKRRLTEDFKKSLEMQLADTVVSVETAPSILHLTCLLYFQRLYDLPLYVSGKYVPAILELMTSPSSSLGIEVSELLRKAHDNVMESRKSPESFDLNLFEQLKVSIKDEL